MAEQYQLPGAFQVPSMAETSYIAGDQQAGANANWKMFTEQINAYTNINNANRLQSLREKEFARQIVQNDRDFDLRREAQDNDIRNSNLTYELNKFNFDRSRETYNQLQEAWQEKDKWMGEIDSLMPNGGNSPTYLTDKARAFRLFAKNPASFTVLTELFKPYDDQFRTFQATKSLEDEAQVQSYLDAGLLDDEMVGDQNASAYWRETLMSRDMDPVAYGAGVRNLKRIAELKLKEQERQRTSLQEAEDIGRFEARRIEAGLPPAKISLEGGKIKLEAAAPRTIGGRGVTGPGVSQIAGAAKDYIEISKNLGEEADALQIRADELGEGLEKQALQSQIDNRRREQQRYIDLARQTSAMGVPTQAPSAPAPTGAAGVLGTPPSKAPKIKDFKTPTPAPATSPAPMSRSTPAPAVETGAITGYVTEEGIRLTESEAKARQAAGQTVLPLRAPTIANPFGEKVTSQGIIGAVSG